MAERLGEYLIKSGKITEKQLVAALERQVIMGGRLGTNMVELGYITESELVQLLSKKFHVPFVQVHELDKIDTALTKLIPRDLAEKYSVVPLKRERNTLSVAILDPQDLKAIDELQFITGCIIKPYLASEARLRFALEKYYQISRPLRYISILEDEREKRGSRLDEAMEGKVSSVQGLESALRAAKESWSDAKDADEVMMIFMKMLSMILDRGILFQVKSGTLSLWKVFPGHREPELAAHPFKLEGLPIFRQAIATKSWFQGPPPSEPIYETFFAALGDPHPSQVLVVPLVAGDRAAALFYGDCQNCDYPPEFMDFIRKATQKISMALEILILRAKILEL